MGLREQISKTRKMAWSYKNPFSGGIADQRKREPLESAALTDLSVVGVIGQAGRKTALVKHNQPPAQLFQVRVGNYLGTQQGRVVAITDQEVVIIELVRNEDGKDIERRSVLPVQPFTAKSHTD
ncbi:pilus assembly protein PilP [Polaromonas sp. P2-4]|nr:pilus assembly protein PilP [Polaromonas sp. P2-4]